MTKVKICGLKEEDHVQTAVRAGASWVGFMFAKSSRQVTIERAAQLVALVPSSVKKVGIFVNPTEEQVHKTVQTVGLDYVQYHGDEDAIFIERLGYPSIKAFSIRTKEDVEKASKYNVDFYLFDAPGTDFAGGSGRVFDWSLLEELSIPKEKVILAGGLNPQNVARAIAQVSPYGVDVSSGVEKDGVKDNELIQQFITAATNTTIKE